MSQDFFTSICTSISNQRLAIYNKSPTDVEIDLLERYFWNIALCESLYPSLQNLEITLRNNIYSAAALSFNDRYWFNDVNILDIQQIESVKDAKKNIKKANKRFSEGLIISELSFGFWTSLFDKKYSRILWHRRDLIRTAFPNMPSKIRTQANLSKRFNDIRRLRNRVFHHEPIWNINNLEQNYDDLIEALGWLNPDLRNTNQLICDRFLIVYRQRSKPYREKLLELISNLS
jgi:hypothetical protein